MAANLSRMLTVAEVAQRYRVKIENVLAWIKAGELVACDVAAGRRLRPRWRIDPEQLADFEKRRRAKPAPKVERRRKREAGVINFFRHGQPVAG